MTIERNELIERILDNYVMGRISRKQMDSMIEVANRRNAHLNAGKKNNSNLVVYMRVGNENQLK